MTVAGMIVVGIVVIGVTSLGILDLASGKTMVVGVDVADLPSDNVDEMRCLGHSSGD